MVPNNQLLPKTKTKRKVTEMCGVLGTASRLITSSFNKRQHISKGRINCWAYKKKREIWKRGSGRNLHQCLQKEFKTHDIKMGRDKFFDVLRNNNLLIKSKRSRTKTTCSYHHFNRYKNLIGCIPLHSNQFWVTDIIYLWLSHKTNFVT